MILSLTSEYGTQIFFQHQHRYLFSVPNFLVPIPVLILGPNFFRYFFAVPFFSGLVPVLNFGAIFSSTMYDLRAEYGGRDEGRLESYLDSDLATEQVNTNVSDWLKC